MTNPLTPEARRAWMKVVVLLNKAADRGAAQASDDPGIHSAAVFAQVVAFSAIALLPAQFDHELDDIDIGDDLAGADFVALVRAAEQAARRYPIEQFPVGASEVIVELGDLMYEAGA